jgi:hypothetical protein
MKEISGVLEMLGSAAVNRNSIGKSFVKFDTIEIGNTILQKMTTARSLEDFMSRGLGQQVTLYVVGKRIVGAKLPGGKVYYWARGLSSLILVCLMGLGFGAMLFGGVAAVSVNAAWMAVLAYWAGLYVLFGADFKHVLKAQPVLKKMGGIPLKS